MIPFSQNYAPSDVSSEKPHVSGQLLKISVIFYFLDRARIFKEFNFECLLIPLRSSISLHLKLFTNQISCNS